MFHFLSRVMAQVEELKHTQAAKTDAPAYKPKDFIGWERRTDNRVYCEVSCNMSNAAQIFADHKLVNISNGGFFVATPRTPALGEHVDVVLKFENPHRTIAGRATVIWENQIADPKTPRGFGCRFVKLSDEDKKFIREYVHKATAAGDSVA
jgi:uncharacterized protein (TIGR02266 family)